MSEVTQVLRSGGGQYFPTEGCALCSASVRPHFTKSNIKLRHSRTARAHSSMGNPERIDAPSERVSSGVAHRM